jgi:1,4-alpha-glucan branching enzyme
VRASTRAGMGARPYPGGVAFRVWAPFATSVSVAGSFNAWSDTADRLACEGNGYWSADLASARAGDQYKYVLANQSLLWRNDPYARELTRSDRNSVVYDPEFDWGSAAYAAPPWNELVLYELHAGTYNDLPGGQPGDFDGIIRRLDYLRDLGINAIEVMPAMEFATDFSWGYNPAQIFAVEQAYGGPSALKRLVRAAHERGIAVILDVVYNHLGPSDLDLWRFDGWSQGDGGGIYFYNDGRRPTPWGDTRPDYGRPEVRQYLRDNALMWLEEFRADGLRWDATAFIRNVYGNNDDAGNGLPDGWGLMQWINDETDARQPWKLHIAEDLRDNDWITRPTGPGGAGFDSQWDGAFVHPVRGAIIPADDGGRDMYALRDAIQHGFGADASRRVIYTESHDEVANGKARVPQEIWPGNPGSYFSRKRSTLGAALVFTSPGIPMIFQGQELLEDEWFRDEDPIDWSKRETYKGIVLMYGDLIRLRRNWWNNTRGLRGHHVNVHHVNNAQKVLAFHRWESGGPGDDVVVVVNCANRAYDSYTIGMQRGGEWKVRFNGDWSGYSADFGNQGSYDTFAHEGGQDGLGYRANVGLGPYTAVILSQDG